MTGLEKVYGYAKDQRIFIYFGKVEFAPALTVKDGAFFDIAVDRDAVPSEAEEYGLLVHELAHIATDSFYRTDTPLVQKRRLEERAFRWSAQFCIPPDEIRSALKNGVTAQHELAEFFNVPEAYLKNCLKYYTEAKNIRFEGS